jgi:hypothetical protein
MTEIPADVQASAGSRALELLHATTAHEGGTGAVLVFSVKPAKVLAFPKGTFGQTRHRFSAKSSPAPSPAGSER